MPLLASLRRLENGTVHPELEDLKKISQTMAASLYRSPCVPVLCSCVPSLDPATSCPLARSPHPVLPFFFAHE